MAKINLSTVHSLKYEGVVLASFRCPGCGEIHEPNVGRSSPEYQAVWGFNGDIEKPTFTPSLLVRTGHYATGHQQGGGECWCTYNQEHPDDPAPFQCTICHSFVTDGRIQFLNDCTHEFAGQTVELPDLEPRKVAGYMGNINGVGCEPDVMG